MEEKKQLAGKLEGAEKAAVVGFACAVGLVCEGVASI